MMGYRISTMDLLLYFDHISLASKSLFPGVYSNKNVFVENCFVFGKIGVIRSILRATWVHSMNTCLAKALHSCLRIFDSSMHMVVCWKAYDVMLKGIWYAGRLLIVCSFFFSLSTSNVELWAPVLLILHSHHSIVKIIKRKQRTK